jgi:hypothetical protein
MVSIQWWPHRDFLHPFKYPACPASDSFTPLRFLALVAADSRHQRLTSEGWFRSVQVTDDLRRPIPVAYFLPVARIDYLLRLVVRASATCTPEKAEAPQFARAAGLIRYNQ